MSLGAVSLGNQEVLQHAQKAVESTPKQLEDFSQILSQLDSGQAGSQTGDPGGIEAAGKIDSDLPALDISRVELPAELDGIYADKLEQIGQPGGPERLLAEAQDKYSRLDQMISELGSGRSYSPEELVGMQSEVHRITFELEATTKVMGEVVSGVKTLLQQQI